MAVSTRVLEQRVRNRVIEYLELVGSYERQIEYSWKVPLASVPHEVITQWEDWVPVDPTTDHEISTVYSTQEIDAMKNFHRAWDRAAQALPDGHPPLAEVHALAEWCALRDEGRTASSVFASRGRMPEDHEVDEPEPSRPNATHWFRKELP